MFTLLVVPFLPRPHVPVLVAVVNGDRLPDFCQAYVVVRQGRRPRVNADIVLITFPDSWPVVGIGPVIGPGPVGQPLDWPSLRLPWPERLAGIAEPLKHIVKT